MVDADPRIISNLIVDQTSNNPAAVAVAGDPGADLIWGTGDDALNDGVSIIGRKVGVDLLPNTQDDIVFFSFENVTPDEGLSAPFNLWFVFFGQFFDHGLDLLAKNPASGTVFIPLQPDDPLIAGADGAFGTLDDLPANLRFMVLTRAENQAGDDGILGDDPTTPGIDEGADDIHEHNNITSPFVDQNQTYASHPSHQVFLREYRLDANGDPVATGRLITNHVINPDGTLGADLGGMSTWAAVKAQARQLLGIELSDQDAVNVPVIKVDPYGNFIPGANGFAQLVTDLGSDGLLGTDDDVTVEGNPAAPISAAAVGALRTGHPFLADIAHAANPFSSQTGAPLNPDADDVVNTGPPARRHLRRRAARRALHGRRRARQREHRADRRPPHLPRRAQPPGRPHQGCDPGLGRRRQRLLPQRVAGRRRPGGSGRPELTRVGRRAPVPGGAVRHRDAVPAPRVRGVRAQDPAAGRRVPAEGQGYDTTIDASIVAEFAHVVYRFGHSMLLDEVDRFSTGVRIERARPDRGVPQSDGVRPQRHAHRRRGGRRHRARHHPPGRQRDRRVQDRGAAQQPPGSAARPRHHQPGARPRHRRPVSQRRPRHVLRVDRRQPAQALRELDRLHAEPAASRSRWSTSSPPTARTAPSPARPRSRASGRRRSPSCSAASARRRTGSSS